MKKLLIILIPILCSFVAAINNRLDNESIVSDLNYLRKNPSEIKKRYGIKSATDTSSFILDSTLCSIAQAKADWMAKTKLLTHNDKRFNGESTCDYYEVSECLAICPTDDPNGFFILDYGVESLIHRKILLTYSGRIGIGSNGNYIVYIIKKMKDNHLTIMPFTNL